MKDSKWEAARVGLKTYQQQGTEDEGGASSALI